MPALRALDRLEAVAWRFSAGAFYFRGFTHVSELAPVPVAAWTARAAELEEVTE